MAYCYIQWPTAMYLHQSPAITAICELQCAQNAKIYRKVHCIIEQYPLLINEGSFESKVCSSVSVDISHNGKF